MVPLEGNAPSSSGYQPGALLLSYRGAMATGEGLEPPWAVRPADLETAAIAAMRTGNIPRAAIKHYTEILENTLRICSGILVGAGGLEPSNLSVKSRLLYH